MSLRKDLEAYVEEETGSVSVHMYPTNHSCDNLLLFTCEAFILMRGDGKDFFDMENFKTWASRFRVAPGVFARYPGEYHSTSHDDYTGLAAASFILGEDTIAHEIADYGVDTDFTWDNDYLGRIIDFEPFVRAAAGMPLGPWNQLKAALGFLANCFEPKAETSGKILLWLKYEVFRGRWEFIDLAIAIWKWRMRKLYGPQPLKEIFLIYFGPAHPFAHAVGDL